MGKEVNFGKLLHGGDYNPEQWLDYPEILEQDLAYFKKARINEVSLGMFSWAFLEPEEGVFRLEWLKEVIDRLYENEIVVMLSTPTTRPISVCPSMMLWQAISSARIPEVQF